MFYPDWPMFGVREDVTQFALSHLTAGAPIAPATLIHTEGGGPRPTGTQMAFSDDNMTGFLSGGCVEADVALHARAALLDGKPRRLIYGHGSLIGDIRLQCGASISIAVGWVLPSDPIVDDLVKMMATRQDVVLISDGTTRTAG
uniref:XdhC family protein n=1 Tax=Neorhizobium sp. EC2-8 TaxID=3129230 RepID=UPI003100FABB